MKMMKMRMMMMMMTMKIRRLYIPDLHLQHREQGIPGKGFGEMFCSKKIFFCH